MTGHVPTAAKPAVPTRWPTSAPRQPGGSAPDDPPRRASTLWRDALLRLACGVVRLYLQHAPGHFGKQRLWDSVVHPYLLWRPLQIEARARFGARFAGSFPDTVHSYMYFFGVWEPAITAVYRAALRPGDVVIDIGANVGTHALLAASLVGDAGQVHAIEASPWIHARLRQNLMANGCPQVVTYNLAATDREGPVTVFIHEGGNLGGTTIMASEAARLGASAEAVVEGRPLPEIVPRRALLSARLIKIDVEGAEWLVIQGMAGVLPLLREDCEILLEVNPAALEQGGGSLEELLAVFAAAGFAPFEVPNCYQSRFYIQPPELTVTPFTRRTFDLADLVFRRP